MRVFVYVWVCAQHEELLVGGALYCVARVMAWCTQIRGCGLLCMGAWRYSWPSSGRCWPQGTPQEACHGVLACSLPRDARERPKIGRGGLGGVLPLPGPATGNFGPFSREVLGGVR